MARFSRMRAVISSEVETLRRTHPDLDAAEMTVFGAPLLARALLISIVAVVPLLVVRAGPVVDATLIPVAGSFTLAATSAAAVTWLTAIVVSGIVTMSLHQRGPRSASRRVAHTVDKSFERIANMGAYLMTAALVGGLVAVAAGLPSHPVANTGKTLVEELLSAQVVVLLGFLAIGFVAEAFRSAAHVVGGKNFTFAWFWSLLVVLLIWFLTTSFGPFEFSEMVRKLMTAWVPESLGGLRRTELVDEVMPRGARWWASVGSLPVLTLIWWIQAKRLHGLDPIREKLAAVPEAEAE